jgi:hypothetical protein
MKYEIPEMIKQGKGVSSTVLSGWIGWVFWLTSLRSVKTWRYWLDKNICIECAKLEYV